MTDTIKIGNLDISAFKVGSDDCKIYLGNTLLYSGGTTPPTPTLQWVTFNNGDTIPSDLDVYGVSGISQDLLNTYGGSGSYIQFVRSKRYVEFAIYNSDSSYCGDGSELATDPMEIIFSNRGCSEFINQGATVSGTIKLYIYA